jgi:hypothetical protein
MFAAANEVCGLRRMFRPFSAAVATTREGHRLPIMSGKEVQPSRPKKVASLHCGLTMSKGNSGTNGISERESTNQPDCEDRRDIDHTLANPAAS